MIRLEQIEKVYGKEETGTRALNGISLQVEKGEFVAVMGTSGSGKSTLLHILGAMDRPTKGAYYFNDIEVDKLSPSALSRFRKEHISFVFQQFSLLGRYSLYENVEIPLIAAGVRAAVRKEKIQNALSLVGIGELAQSKPTKISGGQQQRCAIARAIVGEGELLLADEPTGALDQKTGREICELFEKVNEAGKTIIMVTHDEKVAGFAHRIIRIEDGRMI